MKKLPAPDRPQRPRRGDSVTAETPLTERMRECLLALLNLNGGDDVYRWALHAHYPSTPNEIAYRAGHEGGGRRHGSGAAARGGWSGEMPPSNRVNFALLGLEQRGMVAWTSRRDGRSGRAVMLTEPGWSKAVELRREKQMADGVRTDYTRETPGEEIAVWAVEGYDPENLEPVEASEVMYGPGEEVTVGEEHEMYPGERGTVKAVGFGTGFYKGHIVYDVLVEGTSEAERLRDDELV